MFFSVLSLNFAAFIYQVSLPVMLLFCGCQPVILGNGWWWCSNSCHVWVKLLKTQGIQSFFHLGGSSEPLFLLLKFWKFGLCPILTWNHLSCSAVQDPRCWIYCFIMPHMFNWGQVLHLQAFTLKPRCCKVCRMWLCPAGITGMSLTEMSGWQQVCTYPPILIVPLYVYKLHRPWAVTHPNRCWVLNFLSVKIFFFFCLKDTTAMVSSHPKGRISSLHKSTLVDLLPYEISDVSTCWWYMAHAWWSLSLHFQMEQGKMISNVFLNSCSNICHRIRWVLVQCCLVSIISRWVFALTSEVQRFLQILKT